MRRRPTAAPDKLSRCQSSSPPRCCTLADATAPIVVFSGPQYPSFASPPLGGPPSLTACRRPCRRCPMMPRRPSSSPLSRRRCSRAAHGPLCGGGGVGRTARCCGGGPGRGGSAAGGGGGQVHRCHDPFDKKKKNSATTVEVLKIKQRQLYPVTYGDPLTAPHARSKLVGQP
jgi:hypothetical protein